MEFLTSLVDTLNNIIWSQYILIPLLTLSGLYFTVRTRFLQIRLLPAMVKSITLKPEESIDSEEAISSFEAFTVGLASRVGTGNLAGVAIAIVVGGAGSVFWMWVVAILGAVSSFVESTLAQLYKVQDDNVGYRGGPAYYIRDGLNSKFMGAVFSVLLILCFGLFFNAVQSNTISNAALNTININLPDLTFKILAGLFLITLTSYIVFGGSKRIANFTSKMVPFMAILYIAIGLLVIILRFKDIPTVLHMIFEGAFTADAAVGGAIGITIIQGVKRGLFSNEAGMGSAPNAAASATTDHPVNQGLIQTFGVYIDTLLICSLTAFIILVSGVPLDPSATDGISITMTALSSIVGNWSIYFLLIAIFFFAYSSILGYYYYAQANVEYLSEKKSSLRIYQFSLIGIILFGSISSSDLVWALADLFMGIMAILNITAILLLSKQAFFLLDDYEKQLKEGKNPVFDSSKHKGYEHFAIWNKELNK